MTENDSEKILDTALYAGVLLLKSGAEMRRVEEVVVRIASSFGMDIKDTSYSVANGLMVSYDDAETGTHLSKIKQVPNGIVTRLNQLVSVNQLSRDVAAGKYDIDETREKLREIEHAKDSPVLLRVLCAGAVSMAFLFLLGGGVNELIPAFLGGALSYLFVAVTPKTLSGLLKSFVAGLIIALIACSYTLLLKAVPVSVEKAMIGAVMPLIPGLAFTNGFRDFGNGDYLSGTIRLIDALVTFAAISAGAAAVFQLFRTFGASVPENAGAESSYAIWLHVLLSFVATFTFSVIFQLPLRFLCFAGLTGTISWTVYVLLRGIVGDPFAILLSTAVMTFFARLFSAVLQCPLTGFLVPGIIPTVPGGAMFFAVFHLVGGVMPEAVKFGSSAILTCGAIMLGISMVYAIPQRFFKSFCKKK